MRVGSTVFILGVGLCIWSGFELQGDLDGLLGADPNDLIVAGDTDVDDDHVVLDQQVEFVLVWLI